MFLPHKKIVREALFIILSAVVFALSFNSLNDNGIPLLGNWDTSGGTVSAGGDASIIRSDIEIKEIDAVYRLHKSGVLFIDARSGLLYDEGHIKGALSIPRNDIEMMIENFLSEYTQDQKMIIYCSGIDCEDSHFVADFLINFQYTDVKVFPGGFASWREKGFPIE